MEPVPSGCSLNLAVPGSNRCHWGPSQRRAGGVAPRRAHPSQAPSASGTDTRSQPLTAVGLLQEQCEAERCPLPRGKVPVGVEGRGERRQVCGVDSDGLSWASLPPLSGVHPVPDSCHPLPSSVMRAAGPSVTWAPAGLLPLVASTPTPTPAGCRAVPAGARLRGRLLRAAVAGVSDALTARSPETED